MVRTKGAEKIGSAMRTVVLSLGLLVAFQSVFVNGDIFVIMNENKPTYIDNLDQSGDVQIAFYMDKSNSNPRHLAFDVIFNETIMTAPTLTADKSDSDYIKGASSSYNYYESNAQDTVNQADDQTLTDNDVKATEVLRTSKGIQLRFNNIYFKPAGHFMTLSVPQELRKPFYILPHSGASNSIPVNDAFVGYTPKNSYTTYALVLPWKFVGQTSKNGEYKLVVVVNQISGMFNVYSGTVGNNNLHVAGSIATGTSQRWVADVVTVTNETTLYYTIAHVSSSFESQNNDGCNYRIFTQLIPSSSYPANAIVDNQWSNKQVTCQQEANKSVLCQWPATGIPNTQYTLYVGTSEINSAVSNYIDSFIASQTKFNANNPVKFTQQPQPDGVITVDKLTGTSARFSANVANKDYYAHVLATIPMAGNTQNLYLHYTQPGPFRVAEKPSTTTTPTKTTTPTTTSTSTSTSKPDTTTDPDPTKVTKPSSGSSIWTWIIILGVLGGAFWFYKKKQKENEAAATTPGRGQGDRPLLEMKETKQ